MVYSGRFDKVSGHDHARKVVLYLVADLLNNGHHLFMDNFYNSATLAWHLLENNTLVTGTLRKCRKDCSKVVEKKTLRSGQTFYETAFGGRIMDAKWRDKRDVTGVP